MRGSLARRSHVYEWQTCGRSGGSRENIITYAIAHQAEGVAMVPGQARE